MGRWESPQRRRAGYSEPGCLSDRDSLPHCNQTLYALHCCRCNGIPRKAQVNYLSEKVTAASMSLGKSPALLLTTQFTLYPAPVLSPISGNAYCCVWSIQKANKLHHCKIPIKSNNKEVKLTPLQWLMSANRPKHCQPSSPSPARDTGNSTLGLDGQLPY